MLSANFKPKTTAAASRGSLATARLSCWKFLDPNRDPRWLRFGSPPKSNRLLFGLRPTSLKKLHQKSTKTLDRRQNLIDWSLGHATPKNYQNLFRTSWDTLKKISLCVLPKILENILGSKKNPDSHRNVIDCFLSHVPPVRKISSKYVHNFWDSLHTQTDTQSDECVTSSAEVKCIEYPRPIAGQIAGLRMVGCQFNWTTLIYLRTVTLYTTRTIIIKGNNE